ncbi:MAG: hypothetical protein J6W29_06455 [Neisseriaceae bacterium]|nr:hypothetical protein [Neisseriaceae bacterium]
MGFQPTICPTGQNQLSPIRQSTHSNVVVGWETHPTQNLAILYDISGSLKA